MVGQFTPGFVADGDMAAQFAEIGVILLMFGVGLHFSVRDLLAVRRISLPGAVVQIAVATALGAGVARLWGWSWGEGLVFGLSLSVASTVVPLVALESRDALPFRSPTVRSAPWSLGRRRGGPNRAVPRPSTGSHSVRAERE